MWLWIGEKNNYFELEVISYGIKSDEPYSVAI